jgi:hypothetical protein
MAYKFFEQCIYYMQLVHELPLNVRNELSSFTKNNKSKLELIPELDYNKKMEYWKKLFNIIQKYEFEIFFQEFELIIQFCFLASSDTKYMPFFNTIRIEYPAQKQFKIINLLEFEKAKFSLRCAQIDLDNRYNKKYYS